MTDKFLKRYSYNITANDFMSAGKSASAIKSNFEYYKKNINNII